MEEFLINLKTRNYQKHTVGIIENGLWAPSAGRVMKSMLQEMKEIQILDPVITIEGVIKEKNKMDLENLSKQI